MITKKLIFGLGISIILFSCGQSSEEKAVAEAAFEEQAKLDASNINALVSSSAAVENKKDTTHKFIRTADLKFKVKNVIKSTYDIENITARQSGFVTYTNLTSNIENVNTIAVSADSSLETTYYSVTNNIVLRVPNFKLDTTLKEIAKHIDFLNYRIIKAEDVALSILSNKLTQRRTKKNEDRLINAIDKRGKKLRETTDAEELLLSQQERSDNSLISNLSLQDQIDFSTINLTIYQRQTIRRELISNDKNIDEYEPNLGQKLKESVKTGWEIVTTFFVFITKFWGLILIAIVVIYFLKKSNKKQE